MIYIGNSSACIYNLLKIIFRTANRGKYNRTKNGGSQKGPSQDKLLSDDAVA